MTRGATLFSGGGGCEALLKQRVNFVHAVEYDPAIAAVYRANHGDHVQVASVCDVDYSTWGALDYLHASPVCKEFSQAKTGGVEGDNDVNTALAVVRCIEQTSPRVFSLENVGAYQHSKSYRLICRALDLAGYMWHAEVLNSADFGVPQTRRRLILRAVKDALLPGLAAPERWRGWFESIEDLIPGLPESKFADWQLARLPEEMNTYLVGDGDSWRPIVSCESPSPTVSSANGARAFVVAQGCYGDSLVTANHREPVFTVTSNSNQSNVKAFIVSNAATEYGDGIRAAAEPCHSITAQANGRTRAWLVGDQAASHGTGVQLVVDDEPAFTLTTRASGGTQPRAWLAHGRVVKMSARALARFQSFPDSYILPEKSSLACQIIGNAVPSLMMLKIVEPLL